jgi:hypothetical protein
MKIDVDAIQGMLDLYRSALDDKIPVHPTIQAHFKQNRIRLLDGFTKMAATLSMTLRTLTPENDDEAAQLQEARRIVDEFGAWARGEE